MLEQTAPIVGAVGIILLAAKLAGEIAVRAKQPAVVGEILAGIVLGNVSFNGWTPFQALGTNEIIEVIASLGALILLFEVGVEATVGQMRRTGRASLFVAVIGVVVPFALGWIVGLWLLPQSSPYVHAFLGATLCATSVGLTARVFQDLGLSRAAEARVILGAAVIDDVLGLLILAAVSAAIAAAAGGTSVSAVAILRP